MADVIWGEVVRWIDHNTFELAVRRSRSQNRRQYGEEERIRVVGVIDRVHFTPIDRAQTVGWSGSLVGHPVRCNIRTRDAHGQLICSIASEAAGPLFTSRPADTPAKTSLIPIT